MGVLDYIIKKMEYDVNINDKINFNKNRSRDINCSNFIRR